MNDLTSTLKSKYRLTALSFFSYLLTGGLVVLTGMVINPMAHYFDVSIADAGGTFTWMNLGILIAIVGNSGMMYVIPLKRQIFISVFLTIIAFAGLFLTHDIVVFCALILLFGLVSGITMSIATYLVAHMYMGKQRGMMLLLTDSFFSLAGITFPYVAGSMLDHQIAWHWVYVMVLGSAIIVGLLAVGVSFPHPAQAGRKSQNSGVLSRLRADMKVWGIAVYTCAFAAMCYVLGQLCLVFWIPVYTSTTFHVGPEKAAQPLSNFWIGMWLGLYVSSLIVKRVPMHFFVGCITALSTGMFFILLHATNTHMLSIDCFIMGVFSSGIYYTIITLASLQVETPSPVLVNFTLACGTVGTFLTPIVASKAVHFGGPVAALITGNIFYLVVLIATLIIIFTTRHNKIVHEIPARP